MSRNLAALLAGALFGFGLALAQMIDPVKVLAFLDIAGNWDPSLALVLGSALAVALAGYRLVLRRPRPRLAPRFYLPTRTDVDAKLVLGAVVFGVGWGIGGYCPGPAVAALSLGFWEPFVFIVAAVAGMLAWRGLAGSAGHGAPNVGQQLPPETR